MSQVEMFDNLLSVLNFVKIFCQIFQFRFWVTNNLNVTIKIIQICLENGVYRLRIGKIVRLNHKDKKMNGRSPAYRRAQHRIQCHAISTEHTLKAIFTAFLQVIEYNNETIGLVKNRLAGTPISSVSPSGMVLPMPTILIFRFGEQIGDRWLIFRITVKEHFPESIKLRKICGAKFLSPSPVISKPN